MDITPFERMKVYLEAEGYELEHVVGDGSEGYIYKGSAAEESQHDVILYFGLPTGNEWYWQLDGKIGVDNQACFNKWSQVPFFVWLPEDDDEAQRIMQAIKFLSTPEGYELSNKFEVINHRFGFAVPEREWYE